MLYALNRAGELVRPTPSMVGFCPSCKKRMDAKCGQINVWHWAHIGVVDCDRWVEPESAWHRMWKEVVPVDRCEVVMDNHRADLISNDGTVIELQHSSLSPDEIVEREAFYGMLIWIFDLEEIRSNFDFRPRGTYWSFRWKWPRKSLAVAAQRVFFDFGRDSMFELGKMYPRVPCGGWGHFLHRDDFVYRFLLDREQKEKIRPAVVDLTTGVSVRKRGRS